MKNELIILAIVLAVFLALIVRLIVKSRRLGWRDDVKRELCFGCNQVKVYSGEFCDDCLEAWEDEPPEQVY